MAATGTPTPNIGLRRAQGTDPASVDDINYNSALIDTKLGAVGNSSVQDQIDTLNSNLTGIELFKTVEKTYDNVALSSRGKSGYYISGSTFTVPSGYTPISAVWQNDFITGVYPVLYKNGSHWMITLNSSESCTGVTGTVRITCIKNTVI